MATITLFAGQSTILDAVHLRADERRAAERIAVQAKAHFFGLWLEAPLNLLKERVAKRAKDASDATAEVVAAQAEFEAGAVDWQQINASGSFESMAEAALAAISVWQEAIPAAPKTL